MSGRGIIAIVAAVLVALYALYCHRLYQRQRDILFPGQFMSAPAPVGGDQVELAQLALGFGRVPVWFRPARSAQHPTVVFFHGNAEFIGSVHDVIDGSASLGWGLLLVEYPGYGSADGKPSEQSLDAAAQAALAWLRARAEPPRTIVAMGRSIGTGVAARLAAEQQLAGLILQSPYVSTMQMARRFNAPGFLVRDRYDNDAALRAFDGAVLISHGRHDELIGFEQGQALAAINPAYELIALDCGHNDCPLNSASYWQQLAQWAVRHRLVSAADAS